MKRKHFKRSFQFKETDIGENHNQNEINSQLKKEKCTVSYCKCYILEEIHQATEVNIDLNVLKT